MKKIIITAGGTSEPIDRVRKITNMSTGKLGSIIANQLLISKSKEIDRLYYVCSKNSILPKKHPKLEIIEISDTNSLKETIETLLKHKHIDYFIHSMAVSDYTVDYVTNATLLATNIMAKGFEDIEYVKELINTNKMILDSNSKISSSEDNLIIRLKPTPKIISLIKSISPKTYLVGFKLLDNVSENQLIDVAYNLLNKNKCNLVVANDLKQIKEGTHRAIIIDEKKKKVIANGKDDIAIKLIERMW